MTGKSNERPGGAADAPVSRSAAKASRRQEMREQMLREQARERRRARLRLIGAVVAVVVVIAAIAVTVAVTHKSKPSARASSTGSPAVIKAVTSIPASITNQVGAGSGAIVKPQAITGAPALTADGKPRVLYVGAEYCPYCAAQRWAVVAALSRFGTFTGLGQTSSSSTDVYPDTATLSFHGATYTSQYLSFTGVEQTDRDQQPLDTLSAADEKILNTYDTKKYVGSDGGIPFIDYGGKFASSGAMYSPQILQNLSHAQIARDLSNPSSDVAKAIVGSANVLTGVLCQLTGQQPAAVCDAAGVKAAS